MGGLQCEEGDDIANIGVEYLLVGGVGWCADGFCRMGFGEVFDVC